MASSINASTAGAGGVITTADNTGILNVQTAGITALTISAAQAATFANTVSASSTVTGTALIPSGSTVPTNGVYLPATNAVAIATNSTNVLTVGSNQNVGIGVSGTTPGNKLVVSSTLTGTTPRSNIIARIQSEATNRDACIQISDTQTNSAEVGMVGGSLYFATAGSERVRIDSGGNLLVSSTSSSLTSGNGTKITAGSVPTIGLVGNSANGGQGSYHLYSTSVGQYQFYVTYDGQIWARATSIGALSDVREKTNIKDIDTGLDAIMALKPRRFDWKNGSATNVAGFIAQEVEPILPDLIGEYKFSETETRKSLKMGDILPTLVKAVQELSAKVDAQAAEIAALKAGV
jgi:hypothetical protein